MGLLIDCLYLILLVVMSPWVVYLFISRKKFRQGIWERFGFCDLTGCRQETIWIHGSSVGEITLLKPLISHFEKELPESLFVISAFTPAGQLTARKYFPEHRVFYFPLDLSFIIKRFFTLLKPKIIIIFESEFWPNFIYSAHKHNIPVVLLNGKISQKSLSIYRKLFLFQRVLSTIAILAVQNDEYAGRFHALGIPQEKIVTTGNMKYDLVDTPDTTMKTFLRKKFGYPENSIILIGGSTHSGEDEAIIYAFSRLRKEGYHLDLLLVPRYPENVAHIENIVREYHYIPLRKTLLDKEEIKSTVDYSNSIVIVDTIGELKMMYSVADIAYVGGSLFYRGSNKGGHNMMEPAILGVAIMFGPYNSAFQDTVNDLIEANGAIMIRDREGMYEELKGFLSHPEKISQMGKSAREVILRNQGATRRNFELLRPYL